MTNERTIMHQVPWLRSGVGKTPAQGGCILQVIDWIDRNEWTDRPVCVHPVIATLAIRANDSLDDEGRQRLLDLAPRIMGTAGGDKVLSVRLAVFCARWVLPAFEAKYPGDDRPRKAVEAAEAWCENPCLATRAAASASAAASAAYAYAYAAADAYAYAAADAAASASASASSYELLRAVLDEYDRLTGRGRVEAVDFTPAALAMGLS